MARTGRVVRVMLGRHGQGRGVILPDGQDASLAYHRLGDFCQRYAPRLVDKEWRTVMVTSGKTGVVGFNLFILFICLAFGGLYPVPN